MSNRQFLGYLCRAALYGYVCKACKCIPVRRPRCSGTGEERPMAYFGNLSSMVQARVVRHWGKIAVRLPLWTC